jgi:hypothetical protein
MAEIRDYAPTGFYKARRPFTMDGRDYNYEEPVDMSGVDPRRLRLMWEAKLIDHAPAPTVAVVAPVAPQKPVKASVAAKKSEAKETPVEVAPAPVAPPQAAPDTDQPLRMISKGFGRWDVVDAAGTVIQTGMTKADAERRVNGIGT